jgi:hypothetical protein
MSQAIGVPQVREQLRLGLRRTGAPQMLLRLGYGEVASPTPRRRVEEVLVAEDLRPLLPV